METSNSLKKNEHSKENGVILIVDDNSTNLEVLSDHLTGCGFTVLMKKSGEKALSLIQRKLPDLILLDILMPGMDGFETCQRLKADAAAKDIPVIFMSALSDTVDKVKGFELGAVDYITKPFQHEEVLARVNAHLTILRLKKDLEAKNAKLQGMLDRERKLTEDLRLNLSIALPHELRTPLNAVMGFSQFLTDEKKLPAPEKIAEYGNEIYKGARRLHRLVENALLYANLKLLKYTPCDRHGHMDDFTVNAKDIILSIARKKAEECGRTQDLNLETENIKMRIPSRNIEKILLELLDNAFKFSEPGTPVTVKMVLNGNLGIINVSDQGRGMSQEQVDNIGAYMQFERSWHEQPGSGLGLIISYLLAQLAGGVLSVASTPGKGTTASLVLNIHTDAENSGNASWFDTDVENIDAWVTAEKHCKGICGYFKITASSDRLVQISSQSPEQDKIGIMIMDSREENRVILSQLLRAVGFETHQAEGIRTGLSQAFELKPALIFVNWEAAQADGMEMIRDMRQDPLFSMIRVIAVTTSETGNQDKNQDKNLSALYDAILAAPLCLETVADTLEGLLEIEWICEHGGNATIMEAPPQDAVKKIYDLADLGNITAIYDTLDQIVQSDPRVAPFTSEVKRLTDTFQMKVLRNFIKKYM